MTTGIQVFRLDGTSTDMIPEVRADGWVNYSTGLGMDAKAMGVGFARRRILQPQELATLYYQESLAKRICGKLPETALAKGVTVKCPEATPEQIRTVEKGLRKLAWIDQFRDAATFSRVFGNASVWIATDGDPETRLMPGETVRFSRVVDRRSLIVSKYYTDIREPKHGFPEVYGFIPIGTAFTGTFSGTVHESRMMSLRGTRLDAFERALNGGWDYSVLQSCINEVEDMGETWTSISYLLREFQIKVLSTPALAEKLAKDPLLVQARLALANNSLAVNRMLAIAKDETFETKSPAALAGVAAILDAVLLRIAAASDTPVTILYGRSPAGLNATGESDMESWQSSVTSYQGTLQDPMEEFLQQYAGNVFREIPRDSWSVEFPPVVVETSSERTTRRAQVAQTDVAYIAAGVWSPEQIARLRAGDNAFEISYPETMGETARAITTPDPSQETLEGLGNGSEDPGTPQGLPMPVQGPAGPSPGV